MACNGDCNEPARPVRPRFGHVAFGALIPPGLCLALANAPEEGVVGLANGAQIDETGWVVIPYGDSRHSGKDGRAADPGQRTEAQIEAERMGAIQRFTREDALALVNDFKSTWGRIKRAVVGLPVFRGHPDAPRFARQFPDKAPRGTIADMEARPEGLALRPVLTEQGAGDVDSGWKFVSPYWLARHVGDEDGRKVVAPYKLLSLGLVPRGNIPDLSLVNGADDPPSDTSAIMKECLRKFLASIGLSGVTVPAEGADDTALANALETAGTAIATLKSEKAAAETRAATLQTENEKLAGEKTALANAAEAATGKATAAETALKTVRTAAAKRLVSAAVKAGRITVADSAAQETALANAADFDAEAARIDAIAPRLRTASGLGSLGADGKQEQGRQSTVLGLVNSHMEAHGCDYDTAFAAVQKDPKHAPLFSAMKKPAAK